MKGMSDLSSALMEYELNRDHSLQSQATTVTLSASESLFGTMEHACPNGVTSPGATYCGLREKERESTNEWETERGSNPI